MHPSEVLLRRWDAAAETGALRTSAVEAQWRVLAGDLGVVVTFNPLHRAKKRPVAAALATAVSSDRPSGSAFNFTKARPNEFLCGLHATATTPTELTIVDVEDARKWRPPHHAVLVNVSPLIRGHLLCVFDLCDLQPQSLTFDMLRLAAGVGTLMACVDFALGFNSAGAWSSVNHCHFQGYWMKEVAKHTGMTACNQFPVVRQPRDVLFHTNVKGSPVVISQLPHWPMRCFAIELALSEDSARATDFGAVLCVAWELIHLLQTQGIPHNLLLVWLPRLQVFVFPRQPQQENGTRHFSRDDPGQQLRFAVAEVAGLVVAGSSSTFSDLTEPIYEVIMRHEISLDATSFSTLVQSLRALL